MGIYKNRASAAKRLHHGDRLPLNGCTRVWPILKLLRHAKPYGQLQRGYKHPAFSKTSVPATREVPGIA